MSTQIAWPEAPRALKAGHCSIDACEEVIAAQLESRVLCLEHFLSISEQEMEQRAACLKAKPVDTAAAAALKEFLSGCSQEAETLALSEQFAGGRSRLQGILRRSSQISRCLRRSPRISASVPVWLRREDPRHTWEEETWTSTVSQHGAGFVCRHSVEVNGHVVLYRRDKGKRVDARVVYSRFDSEGRRHVGVELLERDDFWDNPELVQKGMSGHPLPAGSLS